MDSKFGHNKQKLWGRGSDVSASQSIFCGTVPEPTGIDTNVRDDSPSD